MSAECKINYVALMGPGAAEAKDGMPPVASVGADAFELVGLMFVASGDMSLERVKLAVANVRQAVAR